MLVGPYRNYNVLQVVWILFTKEESKAEASPGALGWSAKAAATFCPGSFKECWELEKKVASYICVTWNSWVHLVILALKYGH